MKKRLLFIFIFIFIFENLLINMVYATENAGFSPEITAPSAILIDAATGEILYEKNAHTPMYPASTTKIMTAILTIESLDLSDTVIIDSESPFTTGSRIYIQEGEIFTVEQLLYALLLQSANDVAVALAKHISGDVEEFAKLMNKRAKELGAKNTHFVNSSGLPDEAHVTTAYDLAFIARYAMTLPEFRKIVKTVRYQIPPTNKQPETRYLRNSNRFLWGTGNANKINYRNQWIDIKYDLIDGIKTGYTVQAQQCLVASAEKNGHRLISVVLKAEGKNVYKDSRTLIDYGFEHFKFIKLSDTREKVETVPVKFGEEKYLNLVTENSFYKPIPQNAELNKIDKIIEIDQQIVAPISENQVLGKLIFRADDKYLGEVNLIAEKSIPKKETWWTMINSNLFLKIAFFCLVVFPFCCAFLLAILIFIRRRKRKKKRFF